MLIDTVGVGQKDEVKFNARTLPTMDEAEEQNASIVHMPFSVMRTYT